MGVGIVLFQGFTWVVYQGASSEQWEPLTMAVQIRVMVMYTLMLAGTVLLQYFLELLTGPACSQITVLVYYTSSLFLYDLAQNTAVQRIFAMVFFPNLGFAMRNGAMETENLRLFCCSLAELLAICTILFFISLKVVNKRDIM